MTGDSERAAGVVLLDRRLYSVGEAARLSRLAPRALRRWLDGYQIGERRYPPVIRDRPTGDDTVTWGEFVESGYLREYRARRVPLQHLRPVIDRLRDEYGVPYPLAHFRPFVSDRDLVMTIQREEGLDSSLRIWTVRNNQLQLSPAALAFLEKVDFDADTARLMRPAGKASPVTIDPKPQFGVPMVDGVRTEIIHELFVAGEPVEMIAEGYDLDPSTVQEALRYELSTSQVPCVVACRPGGIQHDEASASADADMDAGSDAPLGVVVPRRRGVLRRTARHPERHWPGARGALRACVLFAG